MIETASATLRQPRRMLGALLRGGEMGTYLRVLALGSGARIFGLASQFVVLILLSRILSKDGFGEMMIAFGIYRVVGTALGVGGSLVLLFHISRRPDDRTLEVGLHRSSALLGAVVSTALALSAALASDWIAGALGKPDLASWLVLLAPFAVFSTLLVIATGALEGRSRVSESILLGEVAPSAVRIVMLPLVALAGLHETVVAHVLTLSVLIPWLWASRRIWSRSEAGLRPWTRWDYQYCGKFAAATLFANQLGAIDLVVAGALFPSAVVADYSIASRVAALFTFLQIVLLKRFAPGAGSRLAAGDLAGLRQDTELCRRLAIGCTALTIAGILAAAPFLLPMFGDFGGALAFLAWLALPAFVTSFYASADRLLLIAGKADVLLGLTVSSFLLLALTPFGTAGWLGLAAIPGAMILSAVLLNPIVAVYAARLYGIATIRPFDAGLMLLVALVLAWHAASVSLASTIVACSTLVAVGAGFLVSTRGAAQRGRETAGSALR